MFFLNYLNLFDASLNQHLLQFNFVTNMIWSGNSCIFGIEINAKIPFFVNLQINLIVILYPGKCLKFDQSEFRFQKPKSKKKAGILRAINERSLIGCLGIEFK